MMVCGDWVGEVKGFSLAWVLAATPIMGSIGDGELWEEARGGGGQEYNYGKEP